MTPSRLITGKTARMPGDLKVRPKAPQAPSKLEEAFLRLWLATEEDLPEPVREFRFHATRKWRFDFAWPEQKVAVEIEGLGGGRHQRRGGFIKDAEKYNAAQVAGWRVLRYTGDDLKKRPMHCIEQVAALVRET